ncbi:hypothetical protein NSQ62_08510 [Solibacillus sp. FSL H8-0523]|uniref:hypothetical protein n=1 Tax=Solibacillus sp. FSL H8-0523 TaxID=2954511 RepID=UPI0031012038
MDLAALIVAIVAILVSLFVAIIQYNKEIKLNRINLESVYINEIYKEYLITGLPNARKHLHITPDGQLLYIDKLVNELNSMRQSSLYYLYNDKEFYNRLKNNCQLMEDFLVDMSSKEILGEDQVEFYNKIQSQMKDIYKVVNEKFMGKKF